VTGAYYVDPDAVIQRVQARKATRRDFIAYLSNWENARQLLGCAYSWFALDFAFYGMALNSSIIFQTIGNGTAFASAPQATGNFTGPQMSANLTNISVGNVIVSVAGSLPGYGASFLVIDSWGRKPLQLMGFIVLTVLFTIMGFGFDALTLKPQAQKAFIFLYCLANFFENFGPNTTTFILPGEAFSTRYRSTSHGICAASGKLGAVMAQVVFSRFAYPNGFDHSLGTVLKITALFMLTGVFSTLLIVETKQRTLEDISNERQDGFVQAVAPSSYSHWERFSIA